jgi:hypothetical protein
MEVVVCERAKLTYVLQRQLCRARKKASSAAVVAAKVAFGTKV